MTHTEPHEESLQAALQTLRDRIGTRWVGREEAGRAEMVRVLQQALGYDKHQANMVINALLNMNRLHYHHHLPSEEQDVTAGEAPAFFGPVGVGGGVAGAGLAIHDGYWEIGPEFE